MVLLRGQAQCEAPAQEVATDIDVPAFDEVYDQYFDFVWRCLKHARVADASLRDAAQDVWLVVHRRLSQFEGRATLRSWLYGITVRVASGYRRTKRRREDPTDVTDLEKVANPLAHCPQRVAERNQSVALVEALLGEMDAEKREVFVLVEFNEMTVPEIATLLGANVNTVYSRLQAGRRQFEAALARHRARLSRGQFCRTS